MKTYRQFNEAKESGVRGRMTPISDEDVRAKFAGMKPLDKIEKGAENGVLWAVEEGIKEMGGQKYSAKSATEMAVRNNHYDIVNYLIDNGSFTYDDLDRLKQDIHLIVPMDEDVRKGFIDKLNEIELGMVKINKDYDKQLSYACKHNMYDLAVESIEKGADVNKKYNTYMWDAISTNNADLVRLLLENGVPSENVKGDQLGSNQQIEKALGTNNVETVKLLLKYGSKIRTGHYSMIPRRISEWVEFGTHHEMIEFLLKNYPEFNETIERKIDELNKKLELYKKYVK
jgi:ankyrin repeat protein